MTQPSIKGGHALTATQLPVPTSQVSVPLQKTPSLHSASEVQPFGSQRVVAGGQLVMIGDQEGQVRREIPGIGDHGAKAFVGSMADILEDIDVDGGAQGSLLVADLAQHDDVADVVQESAREGLVGVQVCE